MISGDPVGCGLFCRKYATNKRTQRISFEDFIHAFLPVNLELAKKLLQRAQKFENVEQIQDLKQVFNPRTYAQYSLTWKTFFQQLRQIKIAIDTFMKNNCYDCERIYFQLDQSRKGFFDRFDFKLYLIENQSLFGPLHDDEMDMMMSYFDRTGQGRVQFDDFVSQFI